MRRSRRGGGIGDPPGSCILGLITAGGSFEIRGTRAPTERKSRLFVFAPFFIPKLRFPLVENSHSRVTNSASDEPWARGRLISRYRNAGSPSVLAEVTYCRL